MLELSGQLFQSMGRSPRLATPRLLSDHKPTSREPSMTLAGQHNRVLRAERTQVLSQAPGF